MFKSGFIYLDTFSNMFWMAMVGSALALVAWLYCSFTGQHHAVVAEIDSFTRIIFDQLRTVLTGYVMNAISPASSPASSPAASAMSLNKGSAIDREQ